MPFGAATREWPWFAIATHSHAAAIAVGPGLATFILLDLLISIPLMAACSDRARE
jgi:hypothetical protein